MKLKYQNIWEKAADNFVWDEPYKELFNPSNNTEYPKWFIGGKLNYTKTIFEKNIDAGYGEKEAIIFYNSPTQYGIIIL